MASTSTVEKPASTKDLASRPVRAEPIQTGANGGGRGSSPLPVGKVLGLSGCALMALGCFLPFVSAPILGSFNFFLNGQGDGVLIVLVAALGAIPLVAGRHHLGSLVAGMAGGGILGYDVWSMVYRINQAKDSAQLSGSGFAFRGAAWANSATIGLGPYVIGIGCLLVVAAAILENERFLARQEELEAARAAAGLDSGTWGTGSYAAAAGRGSSR